LSPIRTLIITVGERGQRDKWVDQKLNQVMILSRVRVKVGKKLFKEVNKQLDKEMDKNAVK